MSNYKFETLQLHVGQEQPDPRPMPALSRFIRPRPTSLRTPPMPPHVSVWQMRAISTAD